MFKALIGATALVAATAAGAASPRNVVTADRIESLYAIAQDACPATQHLSSVDYYVLGRRNGWSATEAALLIKFCTMYLKGGTAVYRETAVKALGESAPQQP